MITGFQRKLRDLEVAKSVNLSPVPKALKLLSDAWNGMESIRQEPLHPPMPKAPGCGC